MALRLAEFELLKNKVNNAPILLLDDLAIDLDLDRMNKIKNLLPDEAQIFITTTSKNAVEEFKLSLENYKTFFIEKGTVTDQYHGTT